MYLEKRVILENSSHSCKLIVGNDFAQQSMEPKKLPLCSNSYRQQ